MAEFDLSFSRWYYLDLSEVTRTENSTYYQLTHPAHRPRGYLLIIKYIFLKSIPRSSIITDIVKMFLIVLFYFLISKYFFVNSSR